MNDANANTRRDPAALRGDARRRGLARAYDAARYRQIAAGVQSGRLHADTDGEGHVQHALHVLVAARRRAADSGREDRRMSRTMADQVLGRMAGFENDLVRGVPLERAE